MMKYALRIFLVSSSLAPVAAQAQVLAFPEAEGFGRFATGARTNLSSASVYHVTNLNDSGPGSFRDAVSQPNRFVVFDVGGIININSVVPVASNITIAGQTAPGGIALFNNRISFTGSNNLISRHFAVRKGNAGVREDAASIARGSNMIFDHMSITWGVDGTFDISPDSGFVIDNITIQNSIIAQGLDRLGHSTGGLLEPGEGRRTSVIRSLYADNVTRNPKVKGENEFINNVVYGWETAGYIMGDSTSTSHANVEGNYFIEGPVNGSSPFTSGTSTFHIYANDNWVDADRDGVLDGTLHASYPGANVVAARHAFPTTATLTAQQAVAHVMKHAGPSIIRDAVDTRLIQEVASYGTLGGVIQRDTDLFPGYGTDLSYLNRRARFVDADNDGIADNWESAHGLSAANGADWKGLSPTGYTWLEEYVNELGRDGATITSSGGAWTTPDTWTGSVPTLADDAVVNGNLALAGGQAFARRLTLDGSLEVTGGTVDVFDTAAYNGSLTISGGVLTAGRVLIASSRYMGSLQVETGGTLQTGTIASGGGAAALILNGGTYRAAGAPDIRVATTLGAAGGTIDTGSYSGTISGALSGSGGLTKQGAGQLLISGPSTYTGPTVVVQGTLKVQNSSALQSSTSIDLAPNTTLDVSSISGGYVTSAGQSLGGAGRLQGSLRLSAGSVLRPEGQFTISDYALGIQAEEMTLGAHWALFNDAMHGTARGGSYNGADLNGGGIILVGGESLSAPTTGGLASKTVDIPQADTWYLFARVAEPSVSVVPGDSATHAGGNNSFFAPGSASSLVTTTTSFDQVQTPDNAADSAKWVLLSPSLKALEGVYLPLSGERGIDYSLRAGSHTFSIGGREVGTILDGFVLTTINLTAAQLDATLSSGTTLFGSSTGMSVSGDFDLADGSLLEIGLGASSKNSLFVGGTAVLAGELAVELADGYQPDSDDVFTILVAGTLEGEFTNNVANSRIATAEGTGSFIVNYDYANDVVTLSDFAALLPGDYTRDGVVDAADYIVWRKSDGAPEGYNTWRVNFGRTAGSGSVTSANAAVPEPATFTLFVVFVTGIHIRPHGKHHR